MEKLSKVKARKALTKFREPEALKKMKTCKARKKRMARRKMKA